MNLAEAKLEVLLIAIQACDAAVVGYIVQSIVQYGLRYAASQSHFLKGLSPLIKARCLLPAVFAGRVAVGCAASIFWNKQCTKGSNYQGTAIFA